MARKSLLEQARHESRDGLEVLASVAEIDKGTKLGRDEQFRVQIRVRNTFEPGGGGGYLGDAVFKDIVVRVIWNTAFATLLTQKDGQPEHGEPTGVAPDLVRKDFPKDKVLEEGQKILTDLWFRTKDKVTDRMDPEEVVLARVSATFDVERYFRLNVVEDADVHIGPE